MKTTPGVVSRYSSILFCCLAVWLCQSQAFAISVGDRVRSGGTVNVRQTAAGTLLGSQISGSQGTVTAGPTVASLGGVSYTWFNINFDSGTDGWVATIGLIQILTLNVASSSPSSGVYIYVGPNDILGRADATTAFSRIFDLGTSITLIAPLTAGGNNFQKWQRNGSDFSFSTTVNFSMSAAYTLTAVYAAAPPVTRTLTVASSNPNSGVSISGNQPDNNGNFGGSTSFTRTFNNNAAVSFNAPSTAGGNVFQKWQRDGSDLTTSATASVTMDADHTITAVYGTASPSVQTLDASAVATTSAQLNGYLNPSGLSTTAYFQYGTTTGYGSTTPSGNFGTTSQNIGYNVSGLLPSMTYHYRIVASSSSGTSYGLDSSFVTAAAPGSTPPTIVTQPQSRTVQAGVNVTFTVGVSGTTTLSYQWLRNGVAMADKTSAAMTLNSVGTFDSDGYSVTVSNAFGTALSSTAWLAVYSAPTNPPPSTPVVVQTNRSPDQFVVVTNAQLKVYSNGVFVSGGTIDLSKMTVVLTHGWNSNPNVWARTVASNMVASGIANGNLLAWEWTDAANTGLFLSRAFSATPGQGRRLGQALASALGSSYGKPIHFVGHSLGTLVNAKAADYLHEQTGGAFNSAKTHVTLLDDAALANIENIIVVFGSYAVPSLEPLLGQSGVPLVGWVSPLPNHSEWVDNYISLVGGRHPEAVNVFLNQGINRANRDNLVTFLSDAHGYGINWYGKTALNPNDYILGNRYSFERLGFNTSPQQACPYPADSLFVQDDYPLGEIALHQPTQSEFDALIRRQSSALVSYGFLAGIFSLDDIGQKIGDSYVDLVVSAAPVIANTASGVASEIFYSLKTVLNSANGSQSQLALRVSATTQDAGGGSEPPCVWLPIVVPTNAVILSFDFTFTGSPGSDVLTANIDGTNVFALEAEFLPQNQKLNSGSIPVVGWAGKSVELFLGLVGSSSSNATVTIDAMRFYQLTPPSLAITTTGNQVVISWPLSAQGFVLESAGTLTGTNQWSVVTNTPATNAIWLQITNSAAANDKFYRLKKP